MMTALLEDQQIAGVIAEKSVQEPSPLRRGTPAATALGLTPREQDVFELIGLALTNREIGRRLRLSEKTVKRHVTAVLRKLGVRNRVEAALIAERQRGPRRGAS